MKNDRRIKHLVSQLHKRPYRDIESWTHDDKLVEMGFLSEDQRIRRLTARMLLATKCDEGIIDGEMIDVWIDWLIEEPARKPESMGKEHVPIPSTKIFRDSSTNQWHAVWNGKKIYLREDATESNARYALALSQKFGFAISPWCTVRLPSRARSKYMWDLLNSGSRNLSKLFNDQGVILMREYSLLVNKAS